MNHYYTLTSKRGVENPLENKKNDSSSFKGTNLKNSKMADKKPMILLFLFFLTNITVFAIEPVTVKSGDASVLTITAKAILEVDYSATIIGGLPLDEHLERMGEEYVRDWPHEREFAINYFEKYFNKKNKGMKLTKEESEAAYKIVIRVVSLDLGSGRVLGGYGNGCIMSGSIDIIDLKTDKIVCTLSVYRQEGANAAPEKTRLGYMYYQLALSMAQLNKKK